MRKYTPNDKKCLKIDIESFEGYKKTPGLFPGVSPLDDLKYNHAI